MTDLERELRRLAEARKKSLEYNPKATVSFEWHARGGQNAYTHAADLVRDHFARAGEGGGDE